MSSPELSDTDEESIPVSRVRRLPSRAHLRFLFIMMLGAYALINVILALLSHVTEGWPVWLSTLIAVPLMVLGMVHVVTPMARPRLKQSGPC